MLSRRDLIKSGLGGFVAVGKELVEANCSVCHSLDYIQMNSPFLDKKGWEASVNKMIKVFGAPIKQEDIGPIVEYLYKHYGKKE